jgi:hypothetical protein
VALTEDYLSVQEEQIKGIESVLTIVGGKVVHAVEEFTPHAPAPIPVLPEWSPVKAFGGYGAPLSYQFGERTRPLGTNVSLRHSFNEPTHSQSRKP